MNNYLSLKKRGLIQRKNFSCFSFKGEALNLNSSVSIQLLEIGYSSRHVG